jgi:hypothetical protein
MMRSPFLLCSSLTLGQVCYLPGNHDLWVRGTTPISPSSFHKFDTILTCAAECGVIFSPLQMISRTHNTLVTICPLYSWYHTNFDTEPNLTHPLYLKYEETLKSQNATFDRQWMDFRQCKWSQTVLQNDFSQEEMNGSQFDSSKNLLLSTSEDNTLVPKWFGQLNVPYLDSRSQQTTDPSFVTTDVISFSHFLPREEILLEKKFLLEPQLSKVSGSVLLEEQVRSLRSQLHIVSSAP